jgi:NAD(P)-dependent dehydrogenase (short-subunit alcohol dehydrogenase family)
VRLADKDAFITGGNGDIGSATAPRFVAEGAKALIARGSQETLRQAARTLGSNLPPLRSGARDVKAINAAVEQVVSAFGKIDIVFANGGASGATRIGGTTLDVNQIGPPHFFQLAPATSHARSV